MPEYQGGRVEPFYASEVYYLDLASTYPQSLTLKAQTQPINPKAESNAKHGKHSKR